MQSWTPKQKGYAMILTSAVCFGSYGVWSRLLGKEFGIFYQGWVRSAVILAVLLPIAILGKRLKPVQKGDRKWFSITMGFTLFTQAPLYFAFNHLPLGTANFLLYAAFIITSYVTGWLFLSEKMTRIKLLSLCLAFVGFLLTFQFSLATFSILALLMAAFSGVASGGEVATSKKSTESYSSLQITIYSWILILATHLPASLMAGEEQVALSLNSEWLAMLGYAASGLGGFWLVIEGFKYVDASIGSLIGLLEILFSVLFGVLLFGDHLTIDVLFGGLIIIFAAMLPDIYALKHRKTKPIPPPPPL
jgi:drug/metabolite transporter (DMT)-like permease